MCLNVWRTLCSSLVCSDSLIRRREDEYDKEGKHRAHFTPWSALILSLLKVLLIWLSQTPNTDYAEAVSGCNIWVGMQFNQCRFTLSLITLETIRNKNTTFSFTSKLSNVLLILRKFRKHYLYKCNAQNIIESNYGMFKLMHSLITYILNVWYWDWDC